MKIRNLVLGSLAYAGLSSGAFAADLGTTLTSLNVCDALGYSGLTIASSTNCLIITGGAAYEFSWGDYRGKQGIINDFERVAGPGTWGIADNDGTAPSEHDWSSKTTAWLKFAGIADSSFGPAQAVIKLNYEDKVTVHNEGGGLVSTILNVKEAYVSVGDTTILMAGRKDSIANFGDDEPMNWLGLFSPGDFDAGIGYTINAPLGGHVIQITSDLGNGISIGAGLENLDSINPVRAGTAVGVLAYSDDKVSAHATVLAGGVLDGTIEEWAVHAGLTADVDMFSFGVAVAADSTSFWDVLGTAKATFDMFTLAVSGEATSGNEIGVGGSISVDVGSGVMINVGGHWFDTDTTVASNEAYQAAAQVVADVTDEVTLTAEAGIYGENSTPASVVYGKGEIAWAPGGGFTSSLGGEFYGNGAYKMTFKAAKDFE